MLVSLLVFRVFYGEGDSISRLVFFWYWVVFSSFCRCFFIIFFFEVVFRVVFMYLYRKFCNKVKVYGCV